MGLDLVEFAFAVENAFGLYLPEPEVADLVTPGLLVDYLVKRLPPADTRQHLDQVAFYRIRKGVMLAFDTRRAATYLNAKKRRLHELNGRAPLKLVNS